MSFAVLTKYEAVILDAGSGLSRLIERPLTDRLAQYPMLHIVLSHYHLDHIMGIFSVLEGWSRKPIIVLAPAPPLVDRPPSALSQFFSPPYLGKPLDEIVPLKIEPYDDSSELTVGSLQFAVRRNQHTGGSVSLRLGDHLAYVTDTPADPATIDFVRGVNLLLHEVWLTDEEAQAQPHEAANHTAVSGAAHIATSAGVRRLMPIHQRPHRDPDRPANIVTALSAACPTVDIVPPEEGKEVRLD